MYFVLLIVTTAPLTRSTSGATVPDSVATAPGGATANAGAPARAAASIAKALERLTAVNQPRVLPAVDNNPARRIIRGERHGDLVTENDADAVLAELAAEVRQYLVPVLELDAEVSRRQYLDDASLKLYMLFATHGGANLTRSQGPGQ
jgi:hypothetical protein